MTLRSLFVTKVDDWVGTHWCRTRAVTGHTTGHRVLLDHSDLPTYLGPSSTSDSSAPSQTTTHYPSLSCEARDMPHPSTMVDVGCPLTKKVRGLKNKSYEVGTPKLPTSFKGYRHYVRRDVSFICTSKIMFLSVLTNEKESLWGQKYGTLEQIK